ncbi:hypothetical protein V475_08530 [Sphingobium baderi LL03]|nr:hypothetical protein V475_08530 [Sphingobium baderi LL03]
MLAGLMAATALGGIAPAYAQSWGERMRGRVEQPSGQAQGQARPGGDAQRGAGRERADRDAARRKAGTRRAAACAAGSPCAQCAARAAATRRFALERE